MSPIKIIATGFGPFPGAPMNPTENLMRQLTVSPPKFSDDVVFQSFVLPTEYAGLTERLSLIGEMTKPDIAVHFGLAASATGFRLEEIARNRVARDKVDAAGICAPSDVVTYGVDDMASRLPLALIAQALRARRLPVEMSQDCGDYLCNALFFHSCAGVVPAFRPCLSGFIHVPQPGHLLSAAQLEAGARIILETSLTAYRDMAAQDFAGLTPAKSLTTSLNIRT